MRFKLIIALAALMMSSSAFAGPAFIIQLDEGCSWGSVDDAGFLATGSVQFVMNDGLQWMVSCHGEIIDGENPERAVVIRSTDDDPVGLCYTPFDTTENWHLVATPSGQSKFSCWGITD